MKCRRIKTWKDDNNIVHKDIVWFGSYGVHADGTAKRYADSDEVNEHKAIASETTLASNLLPVQNPVDLSDRPQFVPQDNYATEQQGVADSLTQRLSVLKNELWYQMNYGLPLFEKYRSKGTMDAYIVSTVLSHPDVRSFASFSSTLERNSYSCNFVVNTTYGEVSVII